MKIAVVGATGLVGRKMLQVLEERNIKPTEFYPVASSKSIGKTINFYGKDYKIIGLNDLTSKNIDVALFSAGSKASKEWAPILAKNGTFVIDNSSAWRMEHGIPLVVPTINAQTITKNTKIIANPNCSTIQMVMILNPIHKKYGIKRIVISTYQSVTGTGKKAVEQLEAEIRGVNVDSKAYPYQIFNNCLPHCDVFLGNDYTKEEMKLVNETQKILNDYSIKITATAVRVPVTGGHSESVNIETIKSFEIGEVKSILANTKGVILYDEPLKNKYPMPIIANGKDEVFVGRVRRDYSVKNGLNLWIVADNLRKGAATNAVEILEYLINTKMV